MKKLLVLLGISLFGCDKQEERTVNEENYKIKRIDGCEYIEFDYGYSNYRVYSLTHKGNCSNKIHSKCTEE